MRSLLFAPILLASAVLSAPTDKEGNGEGKKHCHLPCSQNPVVKIIESRPDGAELCSSLLHVTRATSTVYSTVNVPVTSIIVEPDILTTTVEVPEIATASTLATDVLTTTLDFPQTASASITKTVLFTTVIEDPKTATVSTTVTAHFARTTSVTGKLVSTTRTTTLHPVITSIITAHTTVTVTATSTDYHRTGPALKRDEDGIEKRNVTIPTELQGHPAAIISSACSCIVTATSLPAITVTVPFSQTTVIYATSTSTSIVPESVTTVVSVDVLTQTTVTINSVTISPTVATNTLTFTHTNTVFHTITPVVATETLRFTVDVTTPVTITGPTTTTTIVATSNIPTTTRPTTTITSTHTVTHTVPGPTFTLVNSYNNGCVPYQYQEDGAYTNFDTYDEAFQSCALECETDVGYKCVQIWIQYTNPDGGTGGFVCQTGGGPAENTWNSGTIECGLQFPYLEYGNWYSI